MTTYNWTNLTTGQTVAFDPNADVLNINDLTLSAAELGFSNSTAAGTTTFSFGAKAVTFQTDLKTFATSNLTFADGSVMLFGDNSPSVGADDSANTLAGGTGDDAIIGLGGNDNLSGGAGNDVFHTAYNTASFGNDTIDGGLGFDSVTFSFSNANAINANLATHTVSSVQGTLIITSIETIFGANGNDVFVGGDPAHSTDSAGNTITERFVGRNGNDSITGGGGNGFFTVSDYADNTSGQSISVNLANGTANDGRGGTDTLANIDAIRGGAGNDSIIGGSLSRSGSGTFFESFRGNAGNDTLNGNNANTGGQDASSDRADYANNSASQAVNVNLATGVANDGRGGTDTLIDIDHVYGGAGNDTLTGDALNNDLDGGAGNDVLDGGAGTDTARFQQSTAGVIVNMSAAAITVNSVVVAAGTANDGMGGTDTLISMESVRGSDLDDYIRGSDSESTRQFLSGDAGNDTVDGGAGIDIASYGAVALVLGGLNAFIENGSGTINDKMGGVDTLINVEGIAGTNSSDTLTGGVGNQWLRGNGGSDTLNGGSGTDWVFYSGDPSGVTVNLASGTATDGWNGPSNILGLGGTDTLTSIENAEGSNYNDTLTGSAEANHLRGRTGDDTINGGLGLDTAIFSGARSTYAVTRSASSVTVTGTDGTDTLSGVERLQFSDALIKLSEASLDSNGDARHDLLYHRDGANGANAYWIDLQSGTNTLGGGYLGYSGWSPVDTTLDFDGDGSTDVLWKHDALDGANAYWADLMNGTAAKGGGYLGYDGWSIVHAGEDFNADGKSDVIWKNNSVSGANAYWLDLQNGTTPAGGGYLGYNSWTLRDANSDFNGDGRTDLVWSQNGASGAFSLWVDLMNGTGTLGGGYWGYDGWTLVDTNADFNADGKSDLLWQQNGGSTYWIDLKDGLNNIGGGYLGYAGWSLVDAGGDFNGDGKTDLLWKQNGASGANAYWLDLMNGVSTLGGGYLGYNGWTPVKANDDYNGDAMTDLLWKHDTSSACWIDLKSGVTNLSGSGSVGYNGWSPIDPDISTASVNLSLV